jgi:putative DNA primase/helicase
MGIDLNTGKERETLREDYCMKTAAVAPGGKCPLWLKFLDQVTGGDRELQSYLQRVSGYCMTGHTSEHVLFFIHGSGANGKSVFVNTLVEIWHDYACIAPVETFTESLTDRHPTELARLQGMRLVVSHETEQGRHWAEAKIKSITGGDRIASRFMRQDFFEFTPAFKLMIVGNHKPSLTTVDEATRRRMHLIPFLVTIPPAERDHKLPEKLRAEWGGILQWAVEGCLEWRRIGLAPPAAVRDATEQYLREEDSFARWVEECCVTGDEQWGVGNDLWQSWLRWAERAKERPGNRKSFAQQMANHGYAASKSQEVRGYNRIKLVPAEGYERADWS